MKLPKRSVERLVGDLGNAQLGDPRRTKRAQKVVAKMARRPSAPLPAAMGDEAELEGAYRLANNPMVTFPLLLAAHAAGTKQRAEEARDVLVIHDTTPASFPSLDPAEVGYLATGRAGFYLHASLVVDAGGAWRRPLGVVSAETIHRPKRSKQRRGQRRATGHDTSKQRDRESQRWWRGMEASSQALGACDSVIHIADREGDSYELMAKLLACRQRFIIRVRVNRRGKNIDDEAAGWSTIKDVAARCQGLVERDVPLSRRDKKSAPQMSKVHPPRKMRVARLSFAATEILIPRPAYLREPYPEALELNLVHVLENNPPPGEPAVEWLLYTTEPIGTPKNVITIVDHYRTRWVIEEFNGALKTGCAYETREFQTRHALLTLLALSLPVACEILWLRSRARSTPDAPATDVLTPLQLRILRKMSSRRLPDRATAQQALLAVAALGGHVRANGDPGWKVLARGMALLLAHEAGWTAGASARRRRYL